MRKNIGILLTNTGTPDSPAVADVRSYLKSFLSDPRVVRIPGIIWKPLLNTLILPRRSPYAAELYQKIWTEQGSPLRYLTLDLARGLQNYLNENSQQDFQVEVGMHYGNPSIEAALEKLSASKLDQLLIMPLFPQYSTSTTETARDQTQHLLETTFISHYAGHPGYIQALAQQIREQQRPNHHLLFSFHGLPQAFADRGDPYPQQCEQTVKLLAQALNLPDTAWTLAYQSRFGYAKWLRPYTFETLQALPQRGIRAVSVVCPGFSVDCLETLEEIQIRGKEEFVNSGGESYHYIPALNNSQAHVQALAGILKQTLE